MSIFNALTFTLKNPIKVANFCMGKYVKRRGIPLSMRRGVEEAKRSNRSSAWFYNEPNEYPQSDSFQEWAYDNGFYQEPDYYDDYGSDLD